jgi:hypothetical protein
MSPLARSQTKLEALTMIQTITELVTFDEFIDWYPENCNDHNRELR